MILCDTNMRRFVLNTVIHFLGACANFIVVNVAVFAVIHCAVRNFVHMHVVTPASIKKLSQRKRRVFLVGSHSRQPVRMLNVAAANVEQR